jgi:hypothetical protein
VVPRCGGAGSGVSGLFHQSRVGEFGVIHTQPKGPFAPATLSEVAGMLKHKVAARTDDEIETALRVDARRKWRGRD